MRTSLGWAPEIPDHWSVVPLNYVAKMGTGHTPDRNKTEYWEDCTIPWVTIRDATANPDLLAPLIGTRQKLSRLGLANSAAVVHPAGTVMLSRTASVGYSVVVGTWAATSQDFVTWSPGPRLDSRYLLLVLRAMKPEWERLAFGSTHRTIYMPDMEALRVPLPPLDEQLRISDFLQRETADFDRVLAWRREQNWLLDERLASTLIEAFLGVRSQEWSPTRLKYLFASAKNGVWGSEPSGLNDVVCVRVADFVRGEYRADPAASTIRSVDPTMLAGRQLRQGDVLLEKSGGGEQSPVGFAVSFDGNRRSVCSNFVAALRPATGVDPRFSCLLLAALYRSGRNIAHIKQSTGIQNLDASSYFAEVVRIPDAATQRAVAGRFDAHLADAGRLKADITRQIAVLAERRQAMITAAVTGQIDVSTAQGAAV